MGKIIARATHSTVIVVPNASEVGMPMDTISEDQYDALFNSENGLTFIAPHEGEFRFELSARFASNNVGSRYVALKNQIGGDILAYEAVRAADGTGTSININVTLKIAEDAQVVLRVWQNSGGDLSVNKSTATPNFLIHEISREVAMADILILQTREPGLGDRVIATAETTNLSALQQIAEDVELAPLAWIDLEPGLPSIYAISPNNPRRIWTITTYATIP